MDFAHHAHDASGGSTATGKRLPLAQLITTLVQNGVDPTRLEIKAEIEAVAVGDEVDLNVVLEHPESIVCKALTGNLAMKDWSGFTGTMKRIFETIKKEVHGGDPASYIPILAEANREWFAASICTVDGQQWSTGDLDISFSIQSCTKPIMYAVAVEDRGLAYVHRNGPGFEPSGLSFNEVSLNSKSQPHNPYINSGAIATGALVGPGLDAAARFRHYMGRMQEMAGDSKIGFSHATYLCEHETAWRNNALVAYMQDAGVFPKSVNPTEALDFYLQACSIEVDTKAAATIAATLANGGVCPLNGRRALNPTTVKSTISLMFSCGMYDYSGTWMSTVGLPAKSGVAGLVYVVVPHVMGLAVFSPPLDSHGNSVRGVEFCKRLLQVYPFGIFDQIVRGARFASIGGGSAASASSSASAGAGAGSATPGVGSPALIAASAGDRKSKKLSAIEAVSEVDEATTTTASVYGGGGASGKLRDEGAGGSVMSLSTGHIGGGSGAISRSNRNGRRPSVQASKDAMAAVAGGRETTQSYHSGAARLDAWNRVFRSLVRLHSALRRLRVWCGLPVTGIDLERLVYAAAADGDIDSFPEFAGLIASGGHAVAAASQGPMWEGDAAVQYELYREYRATFGPASHEAFSVEDSIGAATVAAAAAAVSGGSGLGSVADDDLAVSLAADLQPCSFKVPASALRRYIELQGISTGADNPHMHGLWRKLQQRHAARSTRSSMVVSSPAAKSGIGAAAAAAIVSAVQTFTLADLFVPMSAAESRSNTIIRTLLGGLSMPHFRGFVEDMMSIYESVKRKVKDGAVYDQLDIEELSSADPEAFGVAICTVDGQMLNIGETDVEFPLMGAVRPLIYALACADNGVAEVERWVGVEPTAAAAETFSLMPAGGGGHGGPAHEPVKAAPMPADGYFHPEPERAPHPRPFNPFLDSGALAISALMGRAHYPSEQRLFHDNGSRFSHMLNQFRKWCGGRRVGFNNSVFLAQKQKRLKTVAISFYAKGMGVYPAAADPTETANILFQAEAIASTCENLAVIASTLANIGVCPLTQERCLSPEVMKSLLSLMYNSGLCRYTGNWMFQVGIPSASGVSGAHLVVIPGVAGMVIYSPRLNDFDVPSRAVRFCELLTSRYRVNVFDQLVYADQDVAIGEEQRGNSKNANMEQSLMQYELCTAAGTGDLDKVKSLLEDGADPNLADYDLRTALHIACSDGHLSIVQALLEAGAIILSRDRWGSTPLDDARRRRHADISAVLQDALAMQGVRVPHQLPETLSVAGSSAAAGEGYAGSVDGSGYGGGSLVGGEGDDGVSSLGGGAPSAPGSERPSPDGSSATRSASATAWAHHAAAPSAAAGMARQASAGSGRAVLGAGAGSAAGSTAGPFAGAGGKSAPASGRKDIPPPPAPGRSPPAPPAALLGGFGGIPVTPSGTAPGAVASASGRAGSARSGAPRATPANGKRA